MSETRMVAQELGRAVERSHVSLGLQNALGSRSTNTLQRMFRDPRVLEAHDRAELIESLTRVVDCSPNVPEVRVILGMALCVDLKAQEALSHLREAVDRAPDCFIAQLKLGELLMRLRICDQAAEHTHRAAVLANSTIQSELARRQAASIRQMQREGIERGGYRGVLGWVKKVRRPRSSQTAQTALALSE